MAAVPTPTATPALNPFAPVAPPRSLYALDDYGLGPGPQGSTPPTAAAAAPPVATPAPAAPPTGAFALFVSFWNFEVRRWQDNNLRDAGYDPDVEAFHRDLIAANPANRLPGAPTGVASIDCRVHDQLHPEARQAAADRQMIQSTMMMWALSLEGGVKGGVAKPGVIRLYRGVNSGHAFFNEAMNGEVTPQGEYSGGTMDIFNHVVAGDTTNSGLTSWTPDVAFARTFALDGYPNGAIVGAEFGTGEVMAPEQWVGKLRSAGLTDPVFEATHLNTGGQEYLTSKNVTGGVVRKVTPRTKVGTLEVAFARLMATAEPKPILKRGDCGTCVKTDPATTASAEGNAILVRYIAKGEKAEALIAEIVKRARETGKEQGIFALEDGSRAIIEGYRKASPLPSNARRALYQTQTNGAAPSPGQVDSVSVLGQDGAGQWHSYIVSITNNGSEVVRFDTPKPINWTNIDTAVKQNIGPGSTVVDRDIQAPNPKPTPPW